MMKNNALCISLEGIDGVGKSTQAQMLAKSLEEKGFGVLVIHLLKREQVKIDIVKELTTILTSQRETHPFRTDHPYVDTLMRISVASYFSDKIIKPNLENGKFVVVDRYLDSIYAYQTCKILEMKNMHLPKTKEHDLRLAVIKKLHDILVFCRVIEPHVTFLLDMPPKSLFEEGRLDTKLTKADIPFLEKVRETFLLSQTLFPHRIKIINANGKTRQDISINILKMIDKIMMET
jgi:dTMP kinase